MGVGPTSQWPAPQWQRDAKRLLDIAGKACVTNEFMWSRWMRLHSDFVRLAYIKNAERCYAEDPVTFAHFEPLVLALITAKLES